MKICVIGTGSIGKRHIKNIASILSGKNIAFTIDTFRTSDKELPAEIESLIHKNYYNYDELPNDYDIAVIANPTSLHYITIQKMLFKASHFFIEKPIFEKTDYNIDNLNLDDNNVYYVACPLRHKAVFTYIKDYLKQNHKVISARAISSSYLPEWRKGIDYRNTYSARKALGGGVGRDLIHEWDYLVYLFGYPKQIFNIAGHFSELDMDCDDVSIYIAEYKDKVVEVHLDYFGRKTERKLELFFDDERMDIDLIRNEISVYKNSNVNVITFKEEDCYVNEMTYFIDSVLNHTNTFNTINDAYQLLKSTI